VSALLAVALLLAADPQPVAHRKVAAPDGTALALYRYGPHADGKPAVLMVADLGISRRLWDFDNHGLAQYLAERGFEVYVVELPGQGVVTAPAGGYSLDDWARVDLPAIAKVLPDRFDLVAHGWGGTLAIATVGKELDGRVRRIVALSTPGSGAVPNRLAERVLEADGKLSTLGQDPASNRVFDLLFAMNARWNKSTQLLAHGVLSDLGHPAASQLLQWMHDGDFTLGDKDTLSQRLAKVTVPMLLVLPLADEWAPSELASTMRIAVKGPVKLKTYSRFEYAAEDYSHLSLLMGDGAKSDVYPAIFKFLVAEEPK
jgi:pimeloyl-ACP methyl ester carboxylesterase